jgi:hypothetical protein
MSRSSFWRTSLACLVTLSFSTPLHAGKPPFAVKVTGDDANGSPTTVDSGFSSVDETVDYFDPDVLRRYFPNADDGAIGAELDFRGLSGLTLDFAAFSGQLLFTVPQLGFSRTFGAPTDGCEGTVCAELRRQALEELKDFLKSNPDFLKRLLTALARFSPIDPLAGNPDSLFSRRARGDFNYGFTHKVSQIWGCGTSAFNLHGEAPIQVAALGGASDIFAEAQARAAELQAANEIGIGLMTSSTTARSTGGDYQTTSIEVPLSYTAKFDSDPRRKLRVDLPLGYADTDGAVAYTVGLGLAYTHPLSDVWSLTPAIGVGASGSDDLGSAGGVGSYSLTSAYTWRFNSFALSMGNGVGRYEALGLKIGDVEAEADLANTVFTNGVLLTGPNSLIARNLVIEYSFVDTRITGDEVYTDAYQEVGIALGHISTTMGVIDRYTKIGLSYLLARGDFDDIESLRLNLSARF